MSEMDARNWMNRRDPRIKLAVLILVAVQIFALRNPVILILTGMEVALGLILIRMPVGQIAKRLRSILWFGIVIVATNALTQSGHTLMEAGGVIGTWEGAAQGFILTLNIGMLILASSIFVYTTPSVQIVDTLESLGSIGPRITQSLAIILSITLSFSPIMVSTAQQLKKAHLARGIEVESGLLRRIRFVTAAAFPLFAVSFRSAQHLAMAIEGRCYDPDTRRTPFAQLKMDRADKVFLGVALTAFCITLAIHFFQAH